jgi:hypothetical protein
LLTRSRNFFALALSAIALLGVPGIALAVGGATAELRVDQNGNRVKFNLILKAKVPKGEKAWVKVTLTVWSQPEGQYPHKVGGRTVTKAYKGPHSFKVSLPSNYRNATLDPNATNYFNWETDYVLNGAGVQKIESGVSLLPTGDLPPA